MAWREAVCRTHPAGEPLHCSTWFDPQDAPLRLSIESKLLPAAQKCAQSWAVLGFPMAVRGCLPWMALLLISAPLPSLAQSELRNSFPGRRIGGGTRGECSARVLVHLVPANSVYAPGSSKTLGILEGPTAQPRPLQVEFTPVTAGGTSHRQEIPASGPGVTLLHIAAVQKATIWETSQRCEQSSASAEDGGFDFVGTSSPPAKSLLVSDVQPADQQAAASLEALKAACGRTVASATVAKAFDISDVITQEWPRELPVRCL